ncbi:MAG: TrbG/VirB9 family P-type conjugative transfer protein [Coxiellaceae bacterium]|nr:TrbG/VirB9 family P-type conjugative transfer protein [Coxiellaceae bacterium]
MRKYKVSYLTDSVLIFALLVTANVFAYAILPQYTEKYRIQRVLYKPDKIVSINATAFTTTQIVFSKDEIIENVQCGDMDAWTVSIQKNISYMLFLKPTLLGSNTNMAVVTNKRSYYFHLISRKNNTSTTQTYALYFTYMPVLHAGQSLSVTKSILATHKKNWDYSYSGDRQLLPQRVYDDGRFTYLQLRPYQSVPAIFAVNNRNGRETVVNYRRKGNMLIVQQVAHQLSLRMGKYHVLSLFNNHFIKR